MEDYFLNESRYYKNIPKQWSMEYFCLIERELGYLNFDDLRKIKNTHFCFLGGTVASNAVDLLVRLGAENFTICDFDKWEHTNLGRSNIYINDLGKYKVDYYSLKCNQSRTGAV